MASTGEVNWYVDEINDLYQVRHTYSVTYNITGMGERTPRSLNVTGTPKAAPNITGFSLESKPFEIFLDWEDFLPEVTDKIEISYQIFRGLNEVDMELITEVNETNYLDFRGEFKQIRYYYTVKPIFINHTAGNHSVILYSSAIILDSNPGDFSVTVTDRGFDLQWQQPDQAIRLYDHILGYSIYRQIDGEEVVKIEENHQNLSYLDNTTSISERDDHSYHIRASFDTLGEGNSTQVLSGTNRVVPSTPINLTSTIGNCFIHLKWLEPEDDGDSEIIFYEINKRHNSNGTWELLSRITSDITDYNDTSVSMGLSYQYRLSAMNGVGRSTLPAIINTTARWAPDEPRNLTESHGSSWISLDWEPPSRDGGAEIDQYIIYRQKNGGTWEQIGLMNQDQTELNDTSLSIGSKYNYSISTSTIAGRSPPIFLYNIIPATVADPPGELVLTIDGDHILITWDIPVYQGGLDIIEYVVIRNGDIISHIDASLQTYSDHDMTYGETYFYSSVSVNGEGYSTRSGSMELLFCRPSDPPENVTISTSKDSIMIKWDVPFFNGGSWITNYRILRDGYFLAEINNITLEYLDEIVEPGILYEYMVMAINAQGGSQGVNVTIEIPIIPPIISGVTTSFNETGVQISWGKPEEGDVTDIEIYRIKDNGEPLKLATLDVNETSFLDDSIVEPGTYSYYVIGINPYGNSTSFIISELTLSENDISGESDENDKTFPWYILLILGIIIIIVIVSILYILNRRKDKIDPAPSEEITPNDTDDEKNSEISSDPLTQISDNAQIEAVVNKGQIESPAPMETTTVGVQQDVDVPLPQNTIDMPDQSVQTESVQIQQPEAKVNNIETPKQPDPVVPSNNDEEIRSP
ncbi:MAG: fibronectin type III domain-containing protein [Thermoplasmata archaeon]|nr:fibronectin type III domain-containing protein [Thermoplasmata archaeon]